MTLSPPPPVPEFLASPHNLDAFVAAWELGTLDRSRWTHAAHVAVAAYYASRLPADDAFEAMRSGILRFNASVGIENTDSSGYHETLTRFWCETIGVFVRSAQFASPYHARVRRGRDVRKQARPASRILWSRYRGRRQGSQGVDPPAIWMKPRGAFLLCVRRVPFAIRSLPARSKRGVQA